MRVITVDALYGLGHGLSGVSEDIESAYRRFDSSVVALEDVGVELTRVASQGVIPSTVYEPLVMQLRSLENARDDLFRMMNDGRVRSQADLEAWQRVADDVTQRTMSWKRSVELAFRDAGLSLGRSKWLFPLVGVGATLILGGAAVWVVFGRNRRRKRRRR